MDTIWYKNPSKSEVIGRCGGDEKTRMTTQNRQKSNAKNNTNNVENKMIVSFLLFCSVLAKRKCRRLCILNEYKDSFGRRELLFTR